MVKFILWGKAAECRFFLFYSAFAPRQTSFHDAQRHFTMRSIISSSHPRAFQDTKCHFTPPQVVCLLHDAPRHFKMRGIISSSAQLSISRHEVSFHSAAGGLPSSRRAASFQDAQHHFKLGTTEHFKTRSVISHHPGGLPTPRRPASFHDAQHHFKLGTAEHFKTRSVISLRRRRTASPIP